MGSICDVECFVRLQLLSQDLGEVRDGLSNVLYWGFYNAGYRDCRVEDFRQRVTLAKLRDASDLF